MHIINFLLVHSKIQVETLIFQIFYEAMTLSSPHLLLIVCIQYLYLLSLLKSKENKGVVYLQLFFPLLSESLLQHTIFDEMQDVILCFNQCSWFQKEGLSYHSLWDGVGKPKWIHCWNFTWGHGVLWSGILWRRISGIPSLCCILYICYKVLNIHIQIFVKYKICLDFIHCMQHMHTYTHTHAH